MLLFVAKCTEQFHLAAIQFVGHEFIIILHTSAHIFALEEEIGRAVLTFLLVIEESGSKSTVMAVTKTNTPEVVDHACANARVLFSAFFLC